MNALVELSRREFSTLALLTAGLAAKSDVRLGVISYCFRGLPRPSGGDYMPTIVQACQECGADYLELNAFMVEPPGPLPGNGIVPPDRPELLNARDELRRWRIAEPVSRYAELQRQFDTAGVHIFSYALTFGDDFSGEEIEAIFKQAKALGVRIIGTNQTKMSMAPRLVAFAAKYKMMLAFHNHAKVDDTNEVATPESYERLFGMSDYFRANLDVGHFVAGNHDPVAFIERYHDRITHLHMKDRKRDKGPNMPWGEGDTPLKKILALVKNGQYPIYCIVEYEYPGRGTPVEETKRCLGYMRTALAEMI